MSKMINEKITSEISKKFNLNFLEIFIYNNKFKTYIFETNDKNICVFIDDNFTNTNNNQLDYSVYCVKQNEYSKKYRTLLRFNYTNETTLNEIGEMLNKNIDDVDITNQVEIFNKVHIDNSPTEHSFENIFAKAYGNDSLSCLKKEYSISLNNKTIYVDYLVETKNGKCAFEENGVKYHSPTIISPKEYQKQLEKQNFLNLLNIKTFRFSSLNLKNEEKVIDELKYFIGPKENLVNSLYLKANREVLNIDFNNDHLYTHQKEILKKIISNRSKTFLVNIPTGTGKSEIIIQDLKYIESNKELSPLYKKILILVPSKAIKKDWIKRIENNNLNSSFDIEVTTYGLTFKEIGIKNKNYYDYIVFDEAHHAQAPTCKKILEYFTPRFLIGLTATPERLDQKKLEEIFGTYETPLTLKEAVNQNIISDIRCFRIESNIDMSTIRYNGKDYYYSDLEKTLIVDSRNILIVDTIKKYFSPTKDFYKRGLVFCINLDHCNKICKLLNENNITAEVVSGNKDNSNAFKNYIDGKTQFLVTCNLISEGWDSPETEIIVMARPTMSKVLYLQQLGRGTRKFKGKDCLFVLDVVDNYSANFAACNFNSVFGLSEYTPFMNINSSNISRKYLEIFGLHEYELKTTEVSIFNLEDRLKDFLSIEQAARELFIGTQTLLKWCKDKKEYASKWIKIGNKESPYFSNEDIDKIRKDKKLSIHNDDTVYDDFLDFLEKDDHVFSFKLVLILGMLELANEEGDVNVDKLLNYYKSFYLERIHHSLPVDKPNCIYTQEFLNKKSELKNNMFKNPFEKFERKRFLYLAKTGDLNVISFNTRLWNDIKEKKSKESIIKEEKQRLREYYKELGGLLDE